MLFTFSKQTHHPFETCARYPHRFRCFSQEIFMIRLTSRTFARVLLFMLLCLHFSVSPLLAQFETATLTGGISDPQGSSIPKAVLTLTNEATNAEFSATADDDGRYTFNGLRPGAYRLVASAPGFKQSVSSGIVLQVNQSARLDVQLTVGQV